MVGKIPEPLANNQGLAILGLLARAQTKITSSAYAMSVDELAAITIATRNLVHGASRAMAEKQDTAATLDKVPSKGEQAIRSAETPAELYTLVRKLGIARLEHLSYEEEAAQILGHDTPRAQLLHLAARRIEEL